MNRARFFPFWVLSAALFIFLFCPNLLREGMFVDGLWYAAIANNLAQDMGSFWAPKFTETIFPQFYEHPPLQFGIQSIFFRLLGEGMFTERLYCFLITLSTAFTLPLLWRLIYKDDTPIKYISFLPILFWLLNEDVILSYPNNLLECTMNLFTFFSIFVLLLFVNREQERQNNLSNWGLIVIAGVLVYLAFLIKGLVGLFPFAFFICHWLVFKAHSLQKSMLYSFVLLGIFLLCLLFTFQFAAAYNGINTYLQHQVMAALQGERTENIRSSHFYILKRLLEKNLGMILITTVFISIFQYFNILFLTKKDRSYIAFSLLIGITASFPLMISIKQASYYLLPSLPFYCTAFAMMIGRGILFLIEKIRVKSWGYRLFLAITLLFLGYASYYSLSQLGKIDKRDIKLLTDVHVMSKIIPNGTTIGTRTQQFDRALHGYFQRYYYISLDSNNNVLHPYLLVERDLDTLPPENYHRIELSLNKYHLYSIKNKD